MKPKINFITVPVENIEISQKFYQNIFDFPISDQNDELCLFELKDNFFFVIQKDTSFINQTKDSDKNFVSNSFILSHEAASRNEVDAIVKKAEQNGAKKVKTLDEDWGYSVTITDINGHHWEILYTNNKSA